MLGSTGSQGAEPHALASGPVLTRAALCQPPEFPLSHIL
jgi:hypothetical protein